MGNTSLCSNAFSYNHQQPVGAPRIDRFEPPTPDNTTTAIKAVGTAVYDPDVVNLYYGDSCSGSPVNASPAGVTGTAFSVPFTATPLGCTTVTAQAIGNEGAGAISPCSEPAVFAHYGCAQCICTSSNDWIRQVGTFFADRGQAAAFHPGSGSLYLAGTTDGAILGQTALGDSDAFLAEYGSNGNQTDGNAKIQIGTAARDTATSVIVDDASPHFVYVAGSTEGDIDGSGAAPTNADAWIAKYHSFTNARVWIKRYSSPRRDTAIDLAFDGTRIVMLIESSDAATGLVRSPRVVAVALDTGVFTDLWSADDDTLEQSADGLAVAGTNIYVHGRAASPITGALSTTGTTGGGLYVTKLASTASAGTVTWTQHWGSAGDDVAADLIVSGGSVYATGALSGAIEGTDAAGTYAAGQDIGVVKLDVTTGAQVWARIFGTQADDMPTAIGFDVTVQVLGHTRGDLTTGSSVSSYGGLDFFLAPLAAATGLPGAPRQ